MAGAAPPRPLASVVVDHLELDPVPVEEVEPAARLVVGVVKGFEPVALHHLLRRVEIVDHEGNVVERMALGEIAGHVLTCVKRHIIDLAPDVDRVAIVERWPLPPFVPAEQIDQQRGAAFKIRDGNIGVFEIAPGHRCSP